MTKTIRTIQLPAAFYEPRQTLGGGEVRDVMPWEGAVAYVTDGERYGIQYETYIVTRYRSDGDLRPEREVARSSSLGGAREWVAEALEARGLDSDLDALRWDGTGDDVEAYHEYAEDHPESEGCGGYAITAETTVDWLGNDPVRAFGEGAEIVEGVEVES